MATSDYRPTVADVGTRLFARTRTRMGTRIGTFNPSTVPEDQLTVPTAEEVDELIDEALEEVATVVGPLDGDAECVASLQQRAKSRVSLYAAMLVELGYFPEQVASGQSPYDQMERLYDKGLTILRDAAMDCIGGEGESVGGAPAQMPSYSFPADAVIGRRTVM